jgi:hypothetical protein
MSRENQNFHLRLFVKGGALHIRIWCGHTYHGDGMRENLFKDIVVFAEKYEEAWKV